MKNDTKFNIRQIYILYTQGCIKYGNINILYVLIKFNDFN